ncbi:DUF805 domain-containing protein [Lacticaseibacillus sp. N501-2]|uniref:DUF805 domain-containing protein n=1 Tax=Lacticaseibacillus salsurae TaxID=3367729 RepID=UPI0038B3F7E7
MGNPYYGAGGLKAIRGFFANYTNFFGRSSRKEYWWWHLSAALAIAIVGFGLTLGMFGSWANLMRGNTGDMHGGQIVALLAFGSLGGVFGIGTLIPHVALSVRRSRDAGIFWGWAILLEAIIVMSRFVPMPLPATWVNGVTIMCLVIDIGICCLPSRKPAHMSLRGIKMVVIQRLQVVFAGGSIVLTIVALIMHWHWLIGLLLVANMVFSAAMNALMREGRKRAGKIWSLADQLNLSASDLQRLTHAYTVANWEDSRPQHLLFIPDTSVAIDLITTLETQVQALR